MKGNKIKVKNDKWFFEPKNEKFKKSLIESTSICTSNNNYIALPCKIWIDVSKSILSFSKCNSTKFMSYATLFINNNYKQFKEWIVEFVKSLNRWKIILVANSNINTNISWAYKYFSVPDHIVEFWDEFGISLLSKLSDEAKRSELIFFVSAGPAANLIIAIILIKNYYNRIPTPFLEK